MARIQSAHDMTSTPLRGSGEVVAPLDVVRTRARGRIHRRVGRRGRTSASYQLHNPEDGEHCPRCEQDVADERPVEALELPDARHRPCDDRAGELNPSAQQCLEPIGWGVEVESLPGTGVQACGDRVEVGLGEVLHTDALREVLTQ